MWLQHDAGGPAIIGGKLVGIISFGPTVCGFPNAPTVFTLVGAFADWIETVNESVRVRISFLKLMNLFFYPMVHLLYRNLSYWTPTFNVSFLVQDYYNLLTIDFRSYVFDNFQMPTYYVGKKLTTTISPEIALKYFDFARYTHHKSRFYGLHLTKRPTTTTSSPPKGLFTEPTTVATTRSQLRYRRPKLRHQHQKLLSEDFYWATLCTTYDNN